MKNELIIKHTLSKDTLPVNGAELTVYALIDIKTGLYRVCTAGENTAAIGEWLAEMAKENDAKDKFAVVVVKALRIELND